MSSASPFRLPVPSEPAARKLALLLWLGLALVIGGLTVHKMVYRSGEPLTNESEEFAARSWWQQGDLYRPLDEAYFLYLPHAALLYTPFAYGPKMVRNLGVRVAYTVFLMWALYLFAGVGDPEQHGRRFLLMTIATLPVTAHSLRSAQGNMPLAACMLLATVLVARGRWTGATLLLLLGFAFKPLAVVWLMLAGGMWPRQLALRLVAGLAVLAVVPFAFGPPAYVLRQYGDFWTTMTVEMDPLRYYSDIHGLLTWGFGVKLPPTALVVIRALAALGTFAVARVAVRRWDRTGAALALYVLSATYLMLFNPKTEGPTFTLLGPAIGVLLAWALLGIGRLSLAIAFGAIACLIAASWDIWGPRNYWFQPALTVVFAFFVLGTILARRGARAACPWIPTPGGAAAG